MKYTIYLAAALALSIVAFAALGLALAWRTDYAVPPTVADDPGLPRIALDGVVLHGETFGSTRNPAVIVVHGGPGWDYRSLLAVRALADAYFVVLYDQRGSGLSARVDPAALTFENQLADLDGLVDRYGGGRPVNLIGHSFGGVIVAGYVGRHPQKVSGVVLIEPAALTAEMTKHPDFKYPFGLGFALHAAGAWLQSRFQAGPDAAARADYFLGKAIGAYAGASHPLAGYYCGGATSREALDHWRLGSAALFHVQQSLRGDSAGKGDIPVRGLEAFEREVLFLAGTCNVILGPAFQRAQMKYFAHASLAVLDGAGHDMLAAHPEASLAQIRSYLAKHNP